MNFEDLSQAAFYDITIIKLDGKYLMILICEDIKTAKRLHKILKSNHFETILNLKNDKTFDFFVSFTNTTLEIKLEINLTGEEFPEILLMVNNDVNLLTTGVRNNVLPLFYHPDFLGMVNPQRN